MTNSPATERVSARCVACGILVTDSPTPSPPMQQDALANKAGMVPRGDVYIKKKDDAEAKKTTP